MAESQPFDSGDGRIYRMSPPFLPSLSVGHFCFPFETAHDATRPAFRAAHQSLQDLFVRVHSGSEIVRGTQKPTTKQYVR